MSLIALLWCSMNWCWLPLGDQASAKQAGPHNQWQTLSPAGSGFELQLPGRPLHQPRTIQVTNGRPIDVQMFLVNHRQAAAFVFGFHQLAEPMASDQQIDAALHGTLLNAKANLASRKPIQISNYRGCEFTYEGTRGTEKIAGISRVVVADQRVFQLAVLTLSDRQIARPDIERFFASFKILQN